MHYRRQTSKFDCRAPGSPPISITHSIAGKPGPVKVAGHGRREKQPPAPPTNPYPAYCPTRKNLPSRGQRGPSRMAQAGGNASRGWTAVPIICRFTPNMICNRCNLSSKVCRFLYYIISVCRRSVRCAAAAMCRSTLPCSMWHSRCTRCVWCALCGGSNIQICTTWSVWRS